MADHRLRVNWTIPAPIILAIVGQAAAIIWFGATWKAGIEGNIDLLKQDAANRAVQIEARLAMAEKNIASNAALIDRSSALVERVKGVEVNIDVLQKQSQRIESKLDSALEKRR